MRSCNSGRLAGSLNLRRAVNTAVAPNVEGAAPDQLNKDDKQAPRVRAVDDDALKLKTGDLLLRNFRSSSAKEKEEDTA